MQSTTIEARGTSDARPHETAFAKAPVRMLDIGHSRIAYRTLGSGPDLLFIHGWPLHSATFRESASLLSTRFRCHLFDLPGAGETQIGPASPLDLRSHVASTHAVVRALELTRYALVAHDSGGFIARHVAADDPRVVGVVLGNTEIPGWHPAIVSRVTRVVNLPLGPSLLRMLMRSRRFRRSSSGFRGCFRDIDYIDGEFHELFVLPLFQSRARADAMQAIVRTLDERWIHDLKEVHARIHAPVHCIWGEHDRIFPLALAQAMLSQFPCATLEVLPGGKTFAHEEQPAAFATLSARFLEGAFHERAQALA